jgi:hypothetical protein
VIIHNLPIISGSRSTTSAGVLSANIRCAASAQQSSGSVSMNFANQLQTHAAYLQQTCASDIQKKSGSDLYTLAINILAVILLLCQSKFWQ